MAKAKAKMIFQTPLCDIQYVTISGKGKFKYDPNGKLDENDLTNYQYTATGVLSKEQADEVNAVYAKFWKENKPVGTTKQKYDLVKPEMIPDLDANGKEQKDDDDAIIKKPTGRYLLQAKTNAVWPDLKTNVIKVMRGSGAPLALGNREIGIGSRGVIHGTVGINDFGGNEGLNFYLTGVQLKKFVEKTGDEIHPDDLGEDEGLDDLDMDGLDNGPTHVPEV